MGIGVLELGRYGVANLQNISGSADTQQIQLCVLMVKSCFLFCYQ